MELMRELAVGDERALIVVTHDPRIFDLADRIAQMDDGVITRVLDSPEPSFAEATAGEEMKFGGIKL